MDGRLERLTGVIKKYPSALVAFSGGVDSTLLARVAGEALEKRVLLVTAASSTYPLFELEEAKQLAERMGLAHRIIESEETKIEGFSANPPDRCYYCKRELFSRLKSIAEREGYGAVFDGSNSDDLDDYRPGRRALKELGIVSPLVEADLTKSDIRELSAALGLSTASKPSFACLASRFPYGETITREKLGRVGAAEQALRSLGFTQFRVRSHDTCARVEVSPAELDEAWRKRADIREACTKAGFVFVALDVQGYRTGAMNEALGL